MINHNLALYSLLDRTLKVNAYGEDWVVNYTEGDLFELTKKLNDSKTKYPIIWLQSGYKVRRDALSDVSHLEGCRIFLITLGSTHDRYKERYGSAYDEMLYPILMGMEKRFNKAVGFRLDGESSFTTFPFNDTTELVRREAGDKTYTQSTTTAGDIWDALLLEVNIEINDCALDAGVDPSKVSLIQTV